MWLAIIVLGISFTNRINLLPVSRSIFIYMEIIQDDIYFAKYIEIAVTTSMEYNSTNT